MSDLGEHVHIEVVLTVDCCDPSEVPTVTEKLSRMLAGLALDGHDVRLNVFRFAVAEEDEDVQP